MLFETTIMFCFKLDFFFFFLGRFKSFFCVFVLNLLYHVFNMTFRFCSRFSFYLPFPLTFNFEKVQGALKFENSHTKCNIKYEVSMTCEKRVFLYQCYLSSFCHLVFSANVLLHKVCEKRFVCFFFLGT